MRVLVACEFSGIVRDAFRKRGHDAWSCDLLDTESVKRWHIKGDVLGRLADGWDLMVAHPPCTYLTRAGARWWKGRETLQEEALAFVRALMAAPIPRIAVENPPGAIGTRIRPADQYIQPHDFGHPERKMTGLWLKNLPRLIPSDRVLPLCDLVHREPPGPDRWKNRSRFFPGIARAMAQQWGALPALSEAA